MNIFGMTIGIRWIFLIILVIVVWIAVRSLIFAVKRSVLGQFLHLASKVLEEDLAADREPKYDLKEEVRKIDKNFHESEFLQMAEEIFRKYCRAVSENDTRLLKTFETDSLYERHAFLIESNQRKGVKEVQELYKVNAGRILSFQEDAKAELIAELIISSKKYRTDLDGKIIFGSPTNLYSERYLMKFLKNTEVEEQTKTDLTNCPNCGAPHQIISAGVCSYCGTVIVTAKSNWLLHDISKV